MSSKNIILNHTLDEYNKKYKNCRHRLKKFTKQEVDEYDKKNHTAKKAELLKGRKWWLINDTYYEVPNNKINAWWSNLSKGGKIALCALAGVCIAIAIIVPTVMTVTNNSKKEEEKEKEPTQWDKDHGVVPIIKDGVLIYGLFPQTVVSPKTESDLITELEKLTPSTNNYIFYNNEYYAKVYPANPYNNEMTFTDGTLVVKGPYYFKCEPIKWNILSQNGDNYYIESVNTLNAQEWTSSDSWSGKKDQTDYKGETESVYMNNYKYSNVRTYLNTTFYNQAFFLNNKYILDTTVDNRASTTDSPDNIYACKNTVDKVFVRSYKEKEIDLSPDKVCKNITDFAIANGCYMNNREGFPRNTYVYWTRSPNSGNYLSSNCMQITSSSVKLTSYSTTSDSPGIVPSINIKLTK